jgi:hypothetical protein
MSYQYLAYTDKVPLPKHSWSNRRAFVRYQCGPATPGRVLVADVQEWQRAWIIDLSLGGVGLLLSRPLEMGLDLVLHLRSDSQKRKFELTARVAHASRQPDGDWVIGCEFLQPVTDDVLDALL